MFFQTPEDLKRLNSATKYPSIPTYHQLGEKGKLQNGCLSFPENETIVTEKIDGTNGRIIFAKEQGYFIGSREKLLYTKGDLIINPALGIVETLKPIAERLVYDFQIWTTSYDVLLTYYFEVYGGKCSSGSKNYSGTGISSAGLFDIAKVDFSELQNKSASEIASWRDNGGQTFADWGYVNGRARDEELDVVPTLSRDWTPPTSIQETYQKLKDLIPTTNCELDEQAKGKPEGIVIRSDDRSQIAKIRFEDYERTLRQG